MTSGSTLRVDALLAAARVRVERADAELLLAHVLGKSRSWLFAHGDDAIDPRAADRFEEQLQRCEQGEPVAYITGRRGFWTFDLAVTPDTLVPRP